MNNTEAFDIQHGVLIKYKGNDADVIVPDGVTKIGAKAFWFSSEMITVSLPNSVTEIGNSAFYGCRSLTSINIPDNVKKIGPEAFRDCKNLESISVSEKLIRRSENPFKNCTKLADKNGFIIFDDFLSGYAGNTNEIVIPDGIRSIGTSAFKDCLVSKIIIPDSVKEIGLAAFSRSMLRSIIIPDGVKSLNFKAFAECRNLENVSIPNTVTIIDHSAFEACTHLQSIIIPASVKTIRFSAFENCISLKTIKLNGIVDIEGNAFKNCNFDVNTFDRKTVLYFYLIGMRGKVADECQKKINADIDGSINMMIDLLQESGNKTKYNRIVSLVIKNKEKVSEKTLVKLEECLKKDDAQDAIKLLVKNNLIVGDEKTEAKKLAKAEKEKKQNTEQSIIDEEKLLKGERPDEKEVEAFAKQLIATRPLSPEIAFPKNTKVFYRNSKIPVKEYVLRELFTIYLEQFKNASTLVYGDMNEHYELQYVEKLRIDDKADKIYSYLDPEGVDKLLNQLVHGSKYRYYVLSFARFASEESVSRAVNEIKGRKKGTAKDKYWANNVEAALIISDTVEAMRYYDSIKNLNKYAKKRGISEQELRDTLMVPDLGFGQDGFKKYQIGDLDLRITIKPDLSTEIYDCKTQSVLRSLPSKGADPEEIIKMKEDFKSFKNNTKKYAEEKLGNIKQLHINRVNINKDTWQIVYVDHPVIKVLSEGIVWSDGNKYFIPSEGKFLDVNGNPYIPDKTICVANVLDMKQEEVTEWREYLIAHNIKQPFEQIWEPIFNLNDYYGSQELSGLTISTSERNTMKKTLKTKGINVYSDTIESEYDHRAGSYLFSNRNTMHFDNYADAEYTINDDKSITFESIRGLSGNKYAANTILLSLYKILMEQDIKNDRDDRLDNDKLDLFTLAQILTFITIANDNNSTRCKAVLLDYKNNTYPDYNVLDELTLEL